jgi:hypothetical protein
MDEELVETDVPTVASASGPRARRKV